MTRLEQARHSLRWKLLRLIWIHGGSLSRWAAGRMINMARKADQEDSVVQ
jgi:hypothetical protein